MIRSTSSSEKRGAGSVLGAFAGIVGRSLAMRDGRVAGLDDMWCLDGGRSVQPTPRS
jgi:hypothetical protein